MTSSQITSIYKSRNTILELTETQGYATEDYLGFNINEIDAMFNNSQLDMILANPTTNQKVYIKYYISVKQTVKQIKAPVLDEIIEDLFTIENLLTKNDTLIIIIDDEPNESIINKIKYLFDHDGIFVIIYNIQRLQFNILMHSLVPLTTILSQHEYDELLKTYHIKDNLSLPEISRFDPVAMAIGLRPGQVCKIHRQSATALKTNYYRICI